MQQRQQQRFAALLSRTRHQELERWFALTHAQQLLLASSNPKLVQWSAAVHASSGRVDVAPTSEVASIVARLTGASHHLLTTSMIDSLDDNGSVNR
jgi:hypothetical protein